MKKIKHLLLSASVLAPLAIAPIVIACNNEGNYDDNNNDKSGIWLSSSQLQEIKNGFVFTKTEAALNETDAQLIDVIKSLNKKYKDERYPAFYIQNNPEFRKYFDFNMPDISKISISHKINISFEVNETTKQIECHYVVICIDRNNQEESRGDIVLE
ncbi:hypothetical protein [Metamycoplasma neophronis]|uniref:Variable surface lipoprotein n=1 Tax=Metamycoplasma neophronis TaxID=872983 RepID=A0ABY2YZN2_9BACT|nr:hypothetical protein [Metamycoplasma neophronis]TPR53391.1 hypothetical protein FJR74_02665 [Metamycoplasma neophronis]